MLQQLSHDIRGVQRSGPASNRRVSAARRLHLLCYLVASARPHAVPAAACVAHPPFTFHALLADLDVGSSVDRHQKLPVVQFLRDYVAANKPVVLTSERALCCASMLLANSYAVSHHCPCMCSSQAGTFTCRAALGTPPWPPWWLLCETCSAVLAAARGTPPQAWSATGRRMQTGATTTSARWQETRR